MSEQPIQPTPAPHRNHVLLIGVDAYPESPLAGCVNDIVALHRLLSHKFGIDRAEFTILASPRPDAMLPDDVEFDGEATASEIRRALDRLASEQVADGDRVIIHYSGHGGSQEVNGRRRRSIECLLPVDYPDEGNIIYDLEVNRRLADIGKRTRNVTVVLDCCHSAGASRAWGLTIRGVALPSLYGHAAAVLGGVRGRSLGRDVEGEPLVVAACLADELAGEIRGAGTCMGLLTRALVSQLAELSADELEVCGWRELWPGLLAGTEPQHPCLIGDDTRQLFGATLARQPGDIRAKPNHGEYEVFAGSLLDVTEGAEIAVYGPKPTQLPPVGSEAELTARLGTLRVESAARATAVAKSLANFTWPAHPRCRVVSYGRPRLNVAVEGTLPDAVRGGLDRVGAQLVDTDRADVDVRLHAIRDDRWVLSDEVFGLVADGLPELPRFGDDSILAVLAHCTRWRAPLRLAKRCNDLPGVLSVRLLDETIPSPNPQDPDGPELGRAKWPRYVVEFGQRFCIEVRNHSRIDLQVMLVNVASGGQVQILADSTTIFARQAHAFWLGELGNPFHLNGPPGFERVVAIGTNRRDQSPRALRVDEGFEQVIADRARNFAMPEPQQSPEEWTATVITVQGVPGD